ncbi:XRE family transcriptional regulator [Streptomyces sp. NPDC001273]|uniref:XRE family transcriptional regulator n=1 Tax=unclassified Streptomyces TaxID=2593676 RepID=UPI0033D8C026
MVEPQPVGAAPLAVLLAQLGMKPEQLAARINELRARRGLWPLHIKSVYPWIRPAPVRPDKANQADALAVLSVRAGHRVTAKELGWDGPRLRRHSPVRPCLDTPGDAALPDLLHEISKGDPDSMDRRTLLTGAAVTAPGLALLMSGGALRAAQDGDRLSPRLVTGIENGVQELRDLDDTEGSSSNLDWAHGLWQGVARVVINARYRNAEADRLHTAFIEVCEQYGWMLFDADRHAQAQRVYQTGLRLAREVAPVGPARFAAHNLLASAAYQASWLGQHQEAKTLLDVASHGDLPPRVRAVIADREIFAAGRRGDTDALSSARDRGHELLQDAGTDGPWWSRWLTPHALDAATGRAWLAANKPQDATPYLKQRLAVTGPAYPRDYMLATLDLADTYRVSGDIDACTTLALNAAHLTDGVESARAQSRLREVAAALRPYEDRPGVRDLMHVL